MFNWNKKESPLKALAGLGGGVGRGSSSSTSGGVMIENSGITYHVFYSGNTEPEVFEVGSPISSFEFLMLGGGGGGGARYGSSRGSCGGGGAGGYVHGYSKTINSGSYPVQVGTGGVSPIAPLTPGVNGTDTTFWGFVAKGGGGGGAADFVNATGPGLPGGCGGGANEDYAANPNTGGSATQPGTPQPSNGGGSFTQNGGSGGASGHYSAQAGGGGGIGGNGSPGNHPQVVSKGVGGSGMAFPGFPAPVLGPAIPSPERSTWINAVGPSGLFGGGGGGVAYPTTPKAAGGPGGGGAGGNAGVNGTGGGAGGAYPDAQSGGNGIVIIRYPT